MSKFTKQEIYDSFLRFLAVKPIDKITVKEIVEDCGINRKTFYYYFEDIYALANELFMARIEQLQTPSEPRSYKEAFMSLAKYIYDNRNLAEHVFRAMGYEKTDKYFRSQYMKYLPDRIRADADKLGVSDENIALIAEYASVVLSGVFTRWIDEGVKMPPPEVFDRLFAICDGVERLMLENAAGIGKTK